jgi:hypothetical protein
MKIFEKGKKIEKIKPGEPVGPFSKSCRFPEKPVDIPVPILCKSMRNENSQT